MSAERLSLSLPADLVAWVRAQAVEHGGTRSAVVARAIRRLMNEERDRRVMGGLLEDAADDERTVAERWERAQKLQSKTRITASSLSLDGPR